MSRLHCLCNSCIRSERMSRPASKALSLVNRTFNDLTVKSVRPFRMPAGGMTYKADCECACGNRIEVFISCLGKQIGCGCDKRGYLKTTGENNGQFKGFREIRGQFWSRCKRSASERGLPFEISIEYAWELFERQGRTCALSGVPITFGPRFHHANTTASLDRKDNRKGYVEGNVQWVHKRVNIMRHTLELSDFLAWCRAIVRLHGEDVTAEPILDARLRKREPPSGSAYRP